MTVTVTMNYIYSDTLLSSLAEGHCDLEARSNTDINANVNQKGTWSKVGVVILSDSRAELHRPVYPGQEPPQVNNNSSSFPPECGCKAALRGFFCAGWQGRGPGPFLRCDKSCR